MQKKAEAVEQLQNWNLGLLCYKALVKIMLKDCICMHMDKYHHNCDNIST